MCFIVDTYDAITVVGSHGPAYIPSDALLEINRLVKSGSTFHILFYI